VPAAEEYEEASVATAAVETAVRPQSGQGAQGGCLGPRRRAFDAAGVDGKDRLCQAEVLASACSHGTCGGRERWEPVYCRQCQERCLDYLLGLTCADVVALLDDVSGAVCPCVDGELRRKAAARAAASEQRP